jgi:hypothetical protein
MRNKFENAQVQRKTLINAFKDFLTQVLPDAKTRTTISPKLEKMHRATQSSPPPPPPLPSTSSSPATPGFRGFSEEVIYETPTRPVLYEDTLTKVEGHDEPLIEQELLDYNARHFGVLARQYVSPYVYKKQPCYLETQCGIRKVGDQFMLGNSIFGDDTEGNIHIGEPDTAIKFSATTGLWELLTRKKVDKQLVTQSDLQTYKNILELTNAHLERYEPGPTFRSQEELSLETSYQNYFPSRPLDVMLSGNSG